MKIGISIVHFGEQQLLDDCLESFNQNKELHWNTENNEFDIAIFDCNKENVGFTIANNRILSVTNPLCEWMWLLNNDTKIFPETLNAIQNVLPTLDPTIGIVGFKILAMHDNDFIHHAGTTQCFPNGIHKCGSVRLGHLTKRTPEKWVTFASVLIRKEVFDKIGLLDENMKFICSDSDFCYRARAAGFKIIYEPSFVIEHKIGQSSTPSQNILKQMREDTIYFQNKWMNGKLFMDLDTELLK